MLKKNINNWSVVLAGHWNTKIFTPNWISNGRLTENKSILIEVAINNPNLPLRLNFDDIHLIVSEQKIIINPTEDLEEQLNLIESIGIKILEELPHTPLIGVGVNFQFYETEPESELLKIFNILDSGELSDKGYVIESTEIKRKIKEDEQVINFTIGFHPNSNIVFDFNFHKDINNALEAKDYLSKRIYEARRKSISILSEIYNLNLINEGE